jgi:phosphotransferase system  glucose/maltose/N-acetylglucosamine-specific IIC component/phosphotransferase system IIB component
MADTKKLAESILAAVGGKDNVTNVTHCMTRLRFMLKDQGIPNDEQVQAIPGVMGLAKAAGQYQLIIGQDVADVYDALCKIAGLETQAPVDENPDQPKKKFQFKQILTTVVECMTPLFPMLTGVGLIRALCIILSTFNLIDTAGNTYNILYGVASAGMYFLPVFLGYSTAKRFGGTPALGMLMGAMLLQSNVSTVLSSDAPSFLGIPIYNTNVYYSSSIIPAILITVVMCQVEKFFRKHLPKMVRGIFASFLTILIMIPLAFIVLGPLSSMVGGVLSNVVKFISITFGFVALPLYAIAFPWLVSTGMHTAILPPYYFWTFATYGYDTLASVGALINNLNVGMTALAVGLKSRNENMKSLGLSTFAPAILAGVTEPALFGINLKYKKNMIALMIGNGVAGLIAGIAGCTSYSMGPQSIMGLVTYIGDDRTNFYWMIAAVAAGMIASFVATLVLYKDEKVA